MNYYKLIGSSEIKVVGKYPQIIDGIWNLRNNNIKGEFYDIAKMGPIKGNFSIRYAVLHKKAKVTDIINTDIEITMRISPSFYTFLKTHIKAPHQVWDIQVFNSEIKSKNKNYENLKLIIN